MTALRKIYFSITIFGTISIFLIVFCIFPLLKEIKNNSQELILEKEKMILLAQEKESVKKLQGIYSAYQSDFKKIENLFIAPEVPIEFINFLEETARASQIQLEITSMTKKTAEKDPWPSFIFHLSAAGSFPNFLKFLKKTENSPYLIEFLDLNIKKLPEEEVKPKEPLDEIKGFFMIKVFTQ